MGLFETLARTLVNHSWLLLIGPLVIIFCLLFTWCLWQWRRYRLSLLTDYSLGHTISPTLSDEYKLLSGIPIPPTQEEVIQIHLSLYSYFHKLLEKDKNTESSEIVDHETLFHEAYHFFQNHIHYFSEDTRRTISQIFQRGPSLSSSLSSKTEVREREVPTLAQHQVLKELRIYMREHLLQEKIQ